MGAVYFGWRISRKRKGNNLWVLFILVGVFRGNLRETMGGWVLFILVGVFRET